MASRKQIDMKIPLRAAPPPPIASKKVQQTSWQDDLFANDLFASKNVPVQKKKPPPRPPPPRVIRPPVSNSTVPSSFKPDVPQRPAHFNRKPTILSSLMTRKPKPSATVLANNEFQSHIMLPPPKSNQSTVSNTSSLIDFSSPPSSPTLTTRSSSDGLSVDSFGSDITTSTANGNSHTNGGNISQAESGFEDDFELFNNKNNDLDTPQDSWNNFDPFSPPKLNQKPNIARPIYDSDFLDPLCNGKTVKSSIQTHKIPTIIRAKPARPKTPKNSALLSNSLITAKALNTNGFRREVPSNLQDTYHHSIKLFDDGDYSPPMPNIPPPPPPMLEDSEDVLDEVSSREWTPEEDVAVPIQPSYDTIMIQDEPPYGIALYDFPGSHQDDLPFRVNDKIRLLRKLDDEWLFGKLRCGMEGMFPANYIEIKVPLPEMESVKPKSFVVTAMYDFVPQQEGDLGFVVGTKINLLSKVNEDWLYGEIGYEKGQFPSNYVDCVPSELETKLS